MGFAYFLELQIVSTVNDGWYYLLLPIFTSQMEKQEKVPRISTAITYWLVVAAAAEEDDDALQLNIIKWQYYSKEMDNNKLEQTFSVSVSQSVALLFIY